MPQAAKQKPSFSPARAAMAVLCIVAAAVMIKTLLCGLEIDEEYALSISYRLVKGDRLFATMWEPHQLSALPVALVLALFQRVTGGTAGVLLFVRILMLALKAVLAWAFWRLFRPALGRRTAFLAALILFCYTPKWFLAPDYISQQFHFTLAAFLFLFAYYAGGCRHPGLVAGGGVCLCFSILAFPQTVFAAPVYFVGMLVLSRRKRAAGLSAAAPASRPDAAVTPSKTLRTPPGAASGRAPDARSAASSAAPDAAASAPASAFAGPVFSAPAEPRWLGIPRGAAVLALTCLACGALFTVYVLQGTGVSGLIAHARLILNDPQYDFSTAQRLALLFSQAKNVAKLLAKPLALALAISLAGCVRGIVIRRIRNVRYWINLFFALWSAFSIALCLWRAVRDSSLDERYFLPVLALAGLWFFRSGRGTVRQPLFWLGYLPGLAAYLLILRSTLLGLAPTFMYLSWPALCAVLALLAQSREAESNVQNACTPYVLESSWGELLLVLVLAFLVVCRGWMYLTTGWLPQNVADTKMAFLAEGPAAGTWADEDTAQMYGALEQALAGHDGQKVLLTTGDVHGLAYLMDNGTLEVGQASVISSTDSDSRFASYYNELPEKLPDVIIYNANCVRDLAEFHTWLEAHLVITGRQTVQCGDAQLEVLTVDSAKGMTGNAG
jgi:hypothetical protein